MKFSGVIAPILTPFNDDLSLNPQLYLEHAHWLIDNGIHYISPFGTTGEALSMTVNERIEAVDSLIQGGINADRLMPGTGLCNLDDTITLCRHAVSLGCAAVMTLPPFFYKNASDQGLFDYFVRLIETVDDPDLRICLYHIPPMAGIGFTSELTAKLVLSFPETVIAYKDSSGDFDNTKAIMAAAPALSVFSGAETFLLAGLEQGGAGCISATCNVNPQGIRRVYDMATAIDGDSADISLAEAEKKMIDLRKIIESYGPIPAMKGLIAVRRGEPRWRNVRPPLLNASLDSTSQLDSVLAGRLDYL